MAIKLPPLDSSHRRKRKKKPALWPYPFVGIFLGLGIAYYSSRPPGPLRLHFLNGIAPVRQFRNMHEGKTGDEHTIWIVPGTLAHEEELASKELTSQNGWQPPTHLTVGPPNYQFVRIKEPGGDFQFTRVVLTQINEKYVEVELVQDPIQVHSLERHPL